MDRVYNVLFLCTHNSCRSVMSEAALTRWGGDRFRAFSAGSQPSGKVNQRALAMLAEMGFDTSGFVSKSWDVFAEDGAPQLDVIITVCASAAGETCPVWPGRPASGHWGVDDPSAFVGSEDETKRRFRLAYDILEHRVRQLVALPLDDLSPADLKAELARIGQSFPQGVSA